MTVHQLAAVREWRLEHIRPKCSVHEWSHRTLETQSVALPPKSLGSSELRPIHKLNADSISHPALKSYRALPPSSELVASLTRRALRRKLPDTDREFSLAPSPPTRIGGFV